VTNQELYLYYLSTTQLQEQVLEFGLLLFDLHHRHRLEVKLLFSPTQAFFHVLVYHLLLIRHLNHHRDFSIEHLLIILHWELSNCLLVLATMLQVVSNLKLTQFVIYFISQ